MADVSKNPISEIRVHVNLVNILNEQNDLTNASVQNQQSKNCHDSNSINRMDSERI